MIETLETGPGCPPPWGNGGAAALRVAMLRSDRVTAAEVRSMMTRKSRVSKGPALRTGGGSRVNLYIGNNKIWGVRGT